MRACSVTIFYAFWEADTAGVLTPES